MPRLSNGDRPSADRRGDGPTAHAGRLYDTYGASLYRYALVLLADRAAAEDAVQQVFAAILKPGAAAIQEDAHYLRRAVRNECYSILRRSSAVGPAPPEHLLEPVSGVDRPEERIALERALVSLPPEQREVVQLHIYEGMTFQEIAETTGESINTAASRYRYALDKMRKLLS